MAEEFTFKERLGDGAHIDGDEDLVGTVRGAVQGAGHQLFARTVFAQDKHVDVGLGDLVDGLEDALHRRSGPADEVLKAVVEVGAEQALPGAQAGGLHPRLP